MPSVPRNREFSVGNTVYNLLIFSCIAELVLQNCLNSELFLVCQGTPYARNCSKEIQP